MDEIVKGKFYKEITVDINDGEEITYVFPDTNEFISIIKRKLHKELIKNE
ncbi:MAG: hypothetical protein ACFFAK_13045 [Promethearchaeota archaeon]